MKKISAILAALVVLTFVGCASSGGGGGQAAAASGGEKAPYSVDLSTLTAATLVPPGATVYGSHTLTGEKVRNKVPFSKNYDDLLILFPTFPVDVTQYRRVTINAKYFNEAGEEIAQGDSNAMVSLIYDLSGNIRGPEMGAGGNVALKEFNVGGFSGAVSTARGVRVALSKAPSAILLQNSNVGVKFIELTEVTFHD